MDQFIISNDPLVNQDLNHNGKHDGPDNMLCWNWSPGIPFDDIDGNGTIRCPHDEECPAPNDSAASRMPFEDYNGNGVQDSAPGIGVSRGSFRTYGGGSVLNLRFDSAYYFVSDSGLKYYMNGYGAGGTAFVFQQYPESLQFVSAQFHLLISRTDSVKAPSTKVDSTYYANTMAARIVTMARLDRLVLGDSIYNDVLQIMYIFGAGAPSGLSWEFYFGKNRGLLMAVESEPPVGLKGTLMVSDTALPVLLMRAAR